MGGEGKLTNLPVIDFTKKDLKPGTDSWQSTCQSVRQALEDYGCFVAVFHKFASHELRNGLFGSIKELFDLPDETKFRNKYEGVPLKGYVGQNPKIPLHESFGIDHGTSPEGIESFANRLWTQGNDQFCKYVVEYAKVAEELDRMVARMIFESYNMAVCYEPYIKQASYLLRLLQHKGSEEEDHPKQAFVTHTDKSFTTILHQNEVNALEVETKDGQWIKVDFSSPTSFVVMAGDALTVWTNDRVQAPRHKVVMTGKETRYSMGLFTFIRGTVHVAASLIDEQNPPKYKPFAHQELLKFSYSANIKDYCGV
ncbi:hypothetical protein QN277_019452 [Acacia crassicarpa]|uniref:Fe2OG dioxygenase domain-containing protein n=1 Tax=Acacia crassicarpa TaxID=499986 RepID=A0AAE1JMB4_9FABA|nr:hypothetical protein QN277_019452 [Acacia crassicarpa]